jgi:hypothetical protein
LLLAYFFTSGTGFGGCGVSTAFFSASLTIGGLGAYTFWLFWGYLFSLLDLIFSYSYLTFSSSLNSLTYYLISFFYEKMYSLSELAYWQSVVFCNLFPNTYQSRLSVILSKIQEWGCI